MSNLILVKSTQQLDKAGNVWNDDMHSQACEGK